jgi:multisubunit Na+/H+ antiporter MnhF subunit
MSDFVIFAVFFAALAVLNLIRVAKGPTPADRQVAGDNADILVTIALILFSLFSGRAVYLDIAIISAMLGIIDTMLVGRYLDRGRWHYDADSDHS